MIVNKSSILWGLPTLSLMLAMIALWLPWAVVIEKQQNNNQAEYLFYDDQLIYHSGEIIIPIWKSDSQERFFNITSTASNWRWLVSLPALFSLYYLYLYKLEKKPLGCIAVLATIGVIQIARETPEIMQRILSAAPADTTIVVPLQVTNFTLFIPTTIILIMSFVLGILSVFICIRTQMH